MTFLELRKYIENLRRIGKKETKWEVNLYFKISFQLANFIMVIFGAPLAARKRKSGTAFGIGISLLATFLYYAMLKMGQSLGQKGVLEPLVSVGIAHAIFFMLGMLFLWRAEK